MDWGPVITGILTAILIVLSLPFLTDDIDEVVSNQQQLLLQQPKATEFNLFLFFCFVEHVDFLKRFQFEMFESKVSPELPVG